MLSLKTIVSSQAINRLGAEQKVISALAELGYRLPLEEARRTLQDAAGFARPQPAFEDTPAPLSEEARQEIAEAFIHDKKREGSRKTISNVKVLTRHELATNGRKTTPEMQRAGESALLRLRPSAIRRAWETFFQLKTVRGYGMAQLLYPNVSLATVALAGNGRPLPAHVWLGLTIVTVAEADAELADLEHGLAERIDGLGEWQEYRHEPNAFQRLRPVVSPAFTPDEISGAALLETKPIREMLRIIGTARQDKLQAQQITNKYHGSMPADEVQSQLATIGLISHDAMKGTYRITPLGKSLLDKSHWMSILLVGVVSSLGIPGRDIAVEVMDGESEHDGLVALGGSLLLFDLKDSRFDRGHLDKLAGRAREIKPTHVVIWATEGLSDPARRYLVEPGLGASARVMEAGEERTRRAAVTIVESAEALSSDVGSLLERIRYDIAMEALRGLGAADRTLLDIPDAILRTLGASNQPLATAAASKYHIPGSEILIEYDEA